MKSKIYVSFIAIIMMTILAGCGKEANRHISIEQAKIKAQAMELEDLEKEAKIYIAEMQKQDARMAKVERKMKGLKPIDLLGDKGKAIKSEIAVIAEDIGVLKMRYAVYARRYKKLGGDMSKIAFMIDSPLDSF